MLLAMLSPFYVFPRLRNRNLSHIPARRENVCIKPTVFGRHIYKEGSPQIQICLPM